MKIKYAILFGVVLWIALIVGGEVSLLRYDYTPSSPTHSPLKWPADSQIKPVLDRPTLLMFIHPKCPCSRASIGELSRLMTLCQGKLAAHVLFVRSSVVSEKWTKTDLWENAIHIPGVQVSEDIDGKEAERFHSIASGHVLLYSQKNQLLFSGGITGSRGHFGDNDGRKMVEMLVIDKMTTESPKIFPVFGCFLKAQARVVDAINKEIKQYD